MPLAVGRVGENGAVHCALAATQVAVQERRMPSRLLRLVALWAVALAVSPAVGCRRQELGEYVSTQRQEFTDLSEELQGEVRRILRERCGTSAAPKLLGNDSISPEALRRGRDIYLFRCAGCHGDSGDGDGPAAQYLYPRPRDYRQGVFKFTSTGASSRPRREDLMLTIRRGAVGTSMPSFGELSNQELNEVVDYVLALTHRGELEVLLTLEAGGEDEIAAQRVPELIDEIMGLWREARQDVQNPLTTMPAYTAESVEAGKKAFLTEEAGCYKCHGEDGRGRTADNAKGFEDVWRFPTRAADITAGMFHGGDRSDDIYRRIYVGIKGTPMPSFADKLKDQPETFWHLVHYVQHISGARRREVVAEIPPRVQPLLARETAAATEPASPAPPSEAAPPDVAEPGP